MHQQDAARDMRCRSTHGWCKINYCIDWSLSILRNGIICQILFAICIICKDFGINCRNKWAPQVCHRCGVCERGPNWFVPFSNALTDFRICEPSKSSTMRSNLNHSVGLEIVAVKVDEEIAPCTKLLTRKQRPGRVRSRAIPLPAHLSN